MKKNEKIIVALDFNEFEEAENMVKELKDAIFFKVGLQSFIKFGKRILDVLKKENKRVFLDLKFYDIPNTVSGAVKSSLVYFPYFLTIHLLGGCDMIKAAIESSGDNVNIVGVSVLTSLDNKDLNDIGITNNTEKEVLKLVELGLNCGLKHFVCSGKEVKTIRENFGKEPILITPGIRPEWASKGDQKRILTPEKAISLGSDYLVVGRPITKNENPNSAFNKILHEIS